MAQTYSIVRSTFWTGETGKSLKKEGRDAQLIGVYLITCQSSNMIGLYYLPIPLLCHELGMTEEGALEGLRRVSETGFAMYDAPSEVVFVVEMAKQQIGEPLKDTDNRKPKIMALISEMSKCVFFKDFMARYKESFGLKNISPSKGAWKGLGKDRIGQDRNGMVNGKVRGAGGRKIRTPRSGDHPRFMEWYKVYPRHTAVGDAAKSFFSAIESIGGDENEAINLLIERTLAFSKSPAGKKGEFVPYPATWLNQRRWKDDPDSWENDAGVRIKRRRREIAEYKPLGPIKPPKEPLSVKDLMDELKTTGKIVEK